MKLGYVFAALLLTTSVALAGYTQPAPVTVQLDGDGSGFAGGDMVTARFSESDVENIGCGIRVYSNGAGGTFTYGFCQARDADGVRAFCNSQDAELLKAARSTADYSYLQFAWNAAGECTHIGNSTQSFYMPDFRDQGPGAPGRGR